MTEHHPTPDGLLILPRLRVQNANAISSPHTWGFPAPTAFLGFVHALERRLASRFHPRFGGVGIVCHHFEAQTFKPNKRQHRVFTQSRNPVYLKRDAAKFIAEGTPAAIVEEGRAHLEVTLLIAVHGDFDENQEREDFALAAFDTAQGMRLAGGSLLPPGPRAPKAEWVGWPAAQREQHAVFRRLRRRLLPGFALVHRPDLLGERLAKLQVDQADAGILDALLDITRLNHSPVLPEAAGDTPPPDKVDWQIERRPGWLVPLPIGYAGISELHAPGSVANSRDATTPFRFVESLLSLGQWIGPHRLNSLEQLLWHTGGDPQAGLYRCINRYAELLPARDDTASASPDSDLQGA
jgi:CRISPR-associated protein Csy2